MKPNGLSGNPFPFYGTPVIADSHVPEFGVKWEFPYRRFVEFEKTDEAWARKLGFGREVVDKDNRVLFYMKNKVYVHPETLEALKRGELNLQNTRPQV